MYEAIDAGRVVFGTLVAIIGCMELVFGETDDTSRTAALMFIAAAIFTG